ncbi:hypothetical protein GCM10027059_00070 [Myceligenerans halotolerans]
MHRFEAEWTDDTRRDSPGARQIDDLLPTDAHSAVYETKSTSFKNLVAFIIGGDVEMYAPDRTKGNRYGGFDWVDGIDHPDYEPNTVSISDLEADLARRQARP